MLNISFIAKSVSAYPPLGWDSLTPAINIRNNQYMATFRKYILASEQIYHVFNRGIERRSIFTTKREYQRSLDLVNFYRHADLPIKYSKLHQKDVENRQEILDEIIKRKNVLVEIYAYCLMPNHFHFLVKQVKTNGISTFISNFTNSYTKYFNTRHNRSGPLVQGTFQAVLIESDEQIVHTCRYIHLNPSTSFIIKKSEIFDYPWSSLSEYMNNKNGICDKQSIFSHFPHFDSFKQFHLDQISYAQNLDKIKHITLE
jgi:putative transposase